MQRSIHILSAIVLSVLAASCSTAPAPKPEAPSAPAAPRIDYVEVQNRLGLDLAPGQTGFREKKFDACSLGAALEALPVPLADCHQAYFTLVQYQLSCRQDDQPEAMLTEADLRPVAHQRLKWTMIPTSGAQSSGPSETDARGEGQVRTISSKSLKRAHLKVSNGTDFLMFRAGEATQIVTPAGWCR